MAKRDDGAIIAAVAIGAVIALSSSRKLQTKGADKLTHIGGKRLPVSSKSPFPISGGSLSGYPVPVEQYPIPSAFSKFSSRGERAIDAIILHYTTGQNNSSKEAARHAVEGDRRASFHFVIGDKGDVTRLVPENIAAWHCEGWNTRAIGIEHCAYKGEKLSSAQETASVKLIKHLVETYHIPERNILGHRFARLALAGEQGAEETDCPGDIFGQRTKDLAHDKGLVDTWLAKNGIIRPAVA